MKIIQVLLSFSIQLSCYFIIINSQYDSNAETDREGAVLKSLTRIYCRQERVQIIRDYYNSGLYKNISKTLVVVQSSTRSRHLTCL